MSQAPMATLAFVLALVAIVGALVAWTVGAIAHRAAARRAGNAPGVVTTLILWPFTRARTDASAAEQAAMNKAMVAIIACATLAAAAGSVAANLHRIAR